MALLQSPFLNILSDDQVAATLKQMTRPATLAGSRSGPRNLPAIGSKAYISGAIASLGNDYVIGLKAVNCQSGDILAQQQVTAPAKEKVLEVLSGAATNCGVIWANLSPACKSLMSVGTGHHIVAGSAQRIQPANEGRARKRFCGGIAARSASPRA